ncbi:MAG: AAA domain-containing protein [Pirellulales bacterium]
MNLQEYLRSDRVREGFATDDVLASFLPLARETLQAHATGLVAPFEGIECLNLAGPRIWFEEANRRQPRDAAEQVKRIEATSLASVEVMEERRRTAESEEEGQRLARLEIGARGEPITRPVFLAGYVAWEHELGHHDPLTDIYCLGLILASLACGLDLTEPSELEQFVEHRRNLFALRSDLHPALARIILDMTELDRRRRVQDLAGVIHGLENYRDQRVTFEIDLARIPGFSTRDRTSRRQVILSKLRDRLFDLTRRNSLLHFRATARSINLTQASIPLVVDWRNIREDQILFASDTLCRRLADGAPLPLNKYLNFAEMVYLPPSLDRIIIDSRRDLQEYGFAQLRLVLCFLSWTNLKEKPIERFESPLVLLPVRLTKTKGVRDSYSLEALAPEAEINPVLRHQFKQLYGIELPETIDLSAVDLAKLHQVLEAKIRASEAAVSLQRINRPRIDLIHERAKRRVDQYRRTARLSGRGVRSYLELDYSYDPANFHPLGVKLFSRLVTTPSSLLREIVEERPRPRSYMASASDTPDESVKERTFFQLREAGEENPYLWSFDECSVTIANFHYRRMSLVRDYEAVIDRDLVNPAFDATFSLEPRSLNRSLIDVPPLEDRYEVVPCDPTQSLAIAEARHGANGIIQGPPGTGKSQTITNLIADFVARGQRVLFVCEKRAAIDVVYARLKQAGLGTLACLIHDSQADKREFVQDLKTTYEAFSDERVDRQEKSLAKDRARLLERLNDSLNPLEEFDRLMRETPEEFGEPVRDFLERRLSIVEECPTVIPEVAERLPSFSEWNQRPETLAAIRQLLGDLTTDGVWARHPLRLLAPSVSRQNRPIEWVVSAARESLEMLAELEQLLAPCQVEAEAKQSPERLSHLLAYLHGVQRLAKSGNLSLADPRSAKSLKFAEAAAAFERREAAFQAARAENHRWRMKLSPTDTIAALEQAKQFAIRSMPWLSLGWWRLRSVMNRAFDFHASAIRPTWTQALESLSREHAAEAALNQESLQFCQSFRWEESVDDLARATQQVVQALSQAPRWLKQLHVRLMEEDERSAQAIVENGLACESVNRQLHECMDRFATGYRELSWSTLQAELRGIVQRSDQIPRALTLVAELDKVTEQVRATIQQQPWTIGQATAAIVATGWDRWLQEHPQLSRINLATRNLHVGNLAEIYDRWLESNAGEVMTRARRRFLENVRLASAAIAGLTAEQREFKRRYTQGRRILENEFGKSMRFKSIRELVDGDSGVVVRDLKPVWLMSPLSVSDALPLSSDFFDVVMFDEASQVTLEDAAPTLFRGRQVIVVGDEMQLPPTDFFSSKTPEEENEDEAVVIESGESVRYDLRSDSFLSHAGRNLASTMLGWHYRSRSESLISFSNWAFYDGRLLTAPDCRLPVSVSSSIANAASEPVESPIADERRVSGFLHLLDRPLSFHHVAEGVYQDRRNRAEAEYIAQLVRNLLREGKGLSIAIIAFSEAQQDEIESALRRLAEEDDEFRRRYEEEIQREVDGQFVGLLVKNLENIQGDERDVVILSVCYGPGPNGKMLMNFGPINKTGGEKRLNVAFSRAKQFMAVVSSIDHTRITNEFNVGANCLRNYLRYAEAMSRGDLDTARRVLDGLPRWREDASELLERPQGIVAELLRDRLVSRGLIVEQGVGQSHFQVHLAVRRPGREKHEVGILVDGMADYEQSSPMEREFLRPRLLRVFGWRVLTITAKDWLDSPDDVVNAVMTELT